MRPLMRFGLLLLLFVVAPSAEAQTEAHSEVAQALEALRLAALANDADKLDALLSDDCTLIVGPGRLVMKPQYVAFVRGGSIIIDALAFEDVAIRVYGNTAVVTLVVDIRERVGGAPTAGRFRSTRVLVKGDRGWRFVAVQGTRM